jgi:hypothetical protein
MASASASEIGPSTSSDSRTAGGVLTFTSWRMSQPFATSIPIARTAANMASVLLLTDVIMEPFQPRDAAFK